MTVDRISYQKVFPLGMYINERIGVEMQLDKEDSPEYALSKAKEMVEGFHKESNPGLIVEINLDALQTKKVEPEETRIGLLIQDIESCKDIKTLESYKFLVKGKPDFLAAYHRRHRELQALNDKLKERQNK
jgi:hypothetical protein